MAELMCAVQDDLDISRRNPPKKNLCTLVRRVLSQLSSSDGKTTSLNDLGSLNECDKRRRSDILNILQAIKLIDRVSVQTVKWNGFEAVNEAFILIGMQKEIEARDIEIPHLFRLGHSPSLSQIVASFFSIFLFFGKETINIHTAAVMMASSPEQMKHITRRLYLVAFIVEQAGIVEKGSQPSHYCLKYSIEKIIIEIYKRLIEENQFPDWSMEIYMKKLGNPYFLPIFFKRNRILHGIVTN